MTHEELIEHGAEWLKAQNCKVIITDMTSSTRETPDCIGWTGSKSILLEVKVSRSDFLGDKKKTFRKQGGMGNNRYFLVPEGLVKPNEVPEGWGLLEFCEPKGRQRKPRIKRVLGANPKWGRDPVFELRPSHKAENTLLLSALRRIGQTCPKGISVNAYKYETKNRATLGVVPVDGSKT